jgi:NAD(P)H-dependent flavin oxidoreductase YrpB (nitropropane dioxygenase family)
MKTRASEMFGIDVPLFAFSHCRDVVAAVSHAGGLGVLGLIVFSPDQLALELEWLEEHLQGKPYGVDVVMPARYAGQGDIDPEHFRGGFEQMIPDEHRVYAERILETHHVPKLDEVDPASIDGGRMSNENSEGLLDVVFAYSPSLLVNALGPMPAGVVQRAHANGMLTGALVGSVRHALKQAALGVDLIIAQGTEAGGHCGEISTMVLVPDVVDAVEQPVLAAGGIGSGRQFAAALALGAEGAWTGSIWLTTQESHVSPVVRANLLAAGAHDTVRSRAMSGKPCRQLRTAWTEAWDSGDGPPPLDAPLQGMLFNSAEERIERFNNRELAGSAVGQIVGRMNESRAVREIYFDLVADAIDATSRLGALVH